MAKLMRKVEESKAFEARHGQVKEVISADVGDVRAVAVGKVLHFARDWKVFPDFLFTYIAGQLWTEPERNRQQSLPVANQHPAMQWHTAWADTVGDAPRTPAGLAMMNLGGALAYARLGYDLYLQEHNSELKKRLIDRLRDPDHFQGARFETAVAAVMLTAGYTLSFTYDKGPAGRRPEFVATHLESGHQLDVEAKSRRRSGVLGFRLERPLESPAKADVQGRIRDALEQAGDRPLLVFIELNLPALLHDAGGFLKELHDDWEAVRSEFLPNQFPAIGVVFYNDVTPWHVSSAVPEGANCWAYAVHHENRFGFDAKPLLERIVRATMQRLVMPLEFPSTT